ncbi:MAG: dTMP kinase [Erysipelotrichaceae bacterium]
MRNGLFITLEGPDGSGKTTVSQYLLKALSERGFDVVYTREPGGIEISEQIRHVILDPKNTAMDVKTEALLYAASRRQHLIEKVLPALHEGKLVLCDRFVDSSLAYQGVGRGIGFEEVLSINAFAIEGHFPDITLYFDLPAEVGLDRISGRHFLDRLDQEEISFHLRVVEGYKEVIKRFGARISVIDANQEVENVCDDALEVLLKRISEHGEK